MYTFFSIAISFRFVDSDFEEEMQALKSSLELQVV